MLTLVRFHLWRKESMDYCTLVALVCVICLFMCVFSLSMHACMQEFSIICKCKHIYICACLCFLCICCSLSGSLLYDLTHCTQPYTLSPSVCIMFLAWPLFLFAGRAKAEPARQTTTKRRKRKNSASSANSSVGTTTSKKRSPATNFSLSSQVPVSISSTRFASFLIFVSICTCMFAGLCIGMRHP